MNISVIKERHKLNFNNCLKDENPSKSQFIKEFYTIKEIFIKDLLAKGVIFYGFTINFPHAIGLADVMWDHINIRVEELLVISKNIELIEFMYVSIECHGEKQEEQQKNRSCKRTKPKYDKK